MVVFFAGCVNEEKEIATSFNAPLNIGPEWKVYEINADKTVYINTKFETAPNGQRRFKMLRKHGDLASHKSFISVSKKEPELKNLDLNRYSHMKTDEVVDCRSGKWVTEIHYLIDRDGRIMKAIDGRDLDDTVYSITPQIEATICAQK
jgi:hypothetical protein